MIYLRGLLTLLALFSSTLLKNEFGVPISEFCDLWDFLWERVAGTSYFFLLKQDCQCAFSFFDVKRKLLADRYVTFLAHYIVHPPIAFCTINNEHMNVLNYCTNYLDFYIFKREGKKRRKKEKKKRDEKIK